MRSKVLWWWMAGLLAPMLAQAAETAGGGVEKLRGMGLADSAAVSPSLWRVLFAFLLVAALAWAVTWLLRRYGLRLPGSLASAHSSSVRVLSRTSLPGGVTCHLVEAQGHEVLITVTRQGVTSLVLGAAASVEPKP